MSHAFGEALSRYRLHAKFDDIFHTPEGNNELRELIVELRREIVSDGNTTHGNAVIRYCPLVARIGLTGSVFRMSRKRRLADVTSLAVDPHFQGVPTPLVIRAPIRSPVTSAAPSDALLTVTRRRTE